MKLAALPDVTEARITGLKPGALVGMAMGLEPGRVPVPGGAVLSLVPISMSPSVLADPDGHALLRVRYPAGSSAGLKFLAQAVVHDPAIPVGSPGSVTTLPVQQGTVPSPGDTADVVLFFGQSNCEGFGSVGDLRPDLRGAHPMLRIWSHSASAWQPVEAGVNTNMRPNAPFFGAEIGMADSLQTRTSPLWLIKAARSPSSLGPNPGPGNEWGVNAGELYSEMIARVGAATEAMRGLGMSPQVRLVCMMQGESDATDPKLANAYDSNLELLLTRLRADLRGLGLSGQAAPWIRVGLINRGLVRVGLLSTSIVRAAQTTVAGSLPDCDTLETSTLELLPDRIHFNATGLVQMGRRFLGGRL